MVDFDTWVLDMYEEYILGNSKERYYVTYPSNLTTICYDEKKNKVGIARCHPEDKYNYKIGIAVAYAHCRGYDVPKQTDYKKLSEMKNGDKFKIKISGYNYIYIGKDEFNRYVCRNMTTNRYDAFF